MKFELLVAVRYLKAKRKQAVISLITLISVVGVAAGVAALIIALAINAGFTEDLQEKLLGAQAHIRLIPRDHVGIRNYIDLSTRTAAISGVVAAAPSLYRPVLISSATADLGVQMKGILAEMESRMSALSKNVVQGNLADFKEGTILIGQDLANAIGVSLGGTVTLLSSESSLSPIGSIPNTRGFKVVGIFSSGLYDLDSSFVFVQLKDAQRLLRMGDVAGTIEVKVADIYQAKEIGEHITAAVGGNLVSEDWMSLNQSIFEALRLEKVVMFITIGLIVIVAALNIVATLIMMVLEKTRDIAILMSMGATKENIRRVFILQGLIIGVVGTACGIVLGHVVSYLADKYHLIRLAPDVYTIAYVPFRPEPMDTVMVALAAIVISFLATLYPSAAASKLQPVESLRYE